MNRAFDPDEPEMMDRPQPVSRELEEYLENIRRLNEYFGAYRLVKIFLRCWLKSDRPYRVLDLATGFGDVPRMIVDWARAHEISVQIDGVDSHPSTLEIARRHSADYPEITFIQADARTFSSAFTYDVVCCSLALHHFSDADATRILRRARSLSHDHLLVADLQRSWSTWIAIYLLTATVFRNPMTQYDARLSVKRAFSFTELHRLAREAGWQNFSHRRFFPARQAIWMSGKEEAPEVDLDPALDYAT